MRRARMQAAGFGALLVSLLLAGAGVATAAGWLGSDTPPTRTRTVHITIHFSAFDPSDVEIQPGQTIRFVVENTDPIDHEFIVGDEAVQQAHEAGTEAHHTPRPGEISIPPGGQVRPLPEGDRYLGFLFARAGTPAEVEEALRAAHAHLDVVIDPA